MVQLYDVIECLPRDLTVLIEEYILRTCGGCGDKFLDVLCPEHGGYFALTCPRCSEDATRSRIRYEKMVRKIRDQELLTKLRSLREKRLRKSKR